MPQPIPGALDDGTSRVTGENVDVPPTPLWPFHVSMIPALRGVNVSGYSKNVPDGVAPDFAYPPSYVHYNPFQSQKEYSSCLHQLKNLGFNCVRVMVFWENVEPAKGEYNEVRERGWSSLA